MARTGTIDPVEKKELECLIRWPAGSPGEASERYVLHLLLDLCRKQGFGRIPQLVKQIQEIWRDPEKVKEFQKEKEEHLAFMDDCQKSIKESDG